MSAQGRSSQGLAGLCEEGEEFGSGWVLLDFEDIPKQMWRFRGGIRSRAKLPRCFSIRRQRLRGAGQLWGWGTGHGLQTWIELVFCVIFPHFWQRQMLTSSSAHTWALCLASLYLGDLLVGSPQLVSPSSPTACFMNLQQRFFWLHNS